MKKVLLFIICLLIVLSGLSISAGATYYYVSPPSYIALYNKTDTSIEIDWGYVSDADGYVLYCKKAGASFKKIKMFKSKYKLSYVHKHLANGNKYSYKLKSYVKVFGKKKFSKYSSKKTIKVVEPLTYHSTWIYSISPLDTDTFKITWGELSRANGYELFCKTSGESFRKIATLKGNHTTSYTQKNLIADKKYFYKVRGYRKTNSGKKYSKFSTQLGKKCTNYLVDLYSPYQKDNYHEYSNGKTFLMGGEKYGDGFTLSWLSDGYAIFNLKGKYKYIEMIIGNLDGYTQPSTINILSDDKSIGVFEVEGNALPKTVRYDIENANKLEIHRDSDSFGTVCGIAEIKLYK